jgi:hypothetical protein
VEKTIVAGDAPSIADEELPHPFALPEEDH